jgi:hypothetical protein
MGRDRGQGGAEEKAIYGYRCTLCICLLAVVASSLRTGLAATLPVLVLAAFVGAIGRAAIMPCNDDVPQRWTKAGKLSSQACGMSSGGCGMRKDVHE